VKLTWSGLPAFGVERGDLVGGVAGVVEQGGHTRYRLVLTGRPERSRLVTVNSRGGVGQRPVQTGGQAPGAVLDPPHQEVRFLLSDLRDERRCPPVVASGGWLVWVGRPVFGGGRVDRDQILRLLGEREAADRAEWLRLEQEAAQIAGLIEQCRREIERLAITPEVLAGLVTEPVEPVGVTLDLKPAGVFADQLLAVLADAGRPVRCREVVAILGEDPSVALAGDSGRPAG
jgi:hypothetical protein